ncbi:MAG: hypothetical protein Q7U33_10240 [Methylotenera sp.]|uniref:hypothetical protein n=1 Tax=Methylotenera sp. TaxID=2051956 RepID=UPI0027161D18|nr:hypothetical protein [Methylotenera sp.]MDO9151745.1 hypothetical protein [Methylotenera sp.]
MGLNTFVEKSALLEATELDKVRLIAFYLLISKKQAEFSIASVIEVLDQLHLAKPNVSRLRDKLIASSSFIKGSGGDFKLHAKEIRTLEQEYPYLIQKSDDIVSDDTIISTALISNTRGYIELLVRQINASYQFNIFDGCAVLMRRLVEILLILTYENLLISNEIKDSEHGYLSLENIIKLAKQSKKISLSKDSKVTLDIFRELGNYSAHKIYYNARRSDIEPIKLKYRATIEELLYKSGLAK